MLLEMAPTDLDLLRQFTDCQAQDAFAEIVRRHVDLVYSAAQRQVRSSQLAEEITQSVFIDLARNAGKLKPDAVVAAWLYAVTRRTAIDVIRKESRRRLREQIAVEITDMNATANDWSQIEPLLDEAMAALDETDRAAVLLRFFENKSFREVGETLDTSDDVAQKRVSRALERLRKFFARRGIAVGAGGLSVLITANAVQSAPVGLAAAISAAALTGSAVSVSTAIAVTKIIAMTTLQKALIGTTLAVAVGTGIFEAHQAHQLHNQLQSFRQEQVPLTAQVRELQRDLGDATNRLAALLAENARLQSNPNGTELLKLRAEVGRLREVVQENPSVRAARLKQKLDEMPDKKIPELTFLTEKDWLNAAWNADLDSDDGVRLALSKLRDEAVDTFLNLTREALKKYLAANNDILPPDLLPLKPYYDTPVTDDMLRRYAFMQTGQLSRDLSQSVVRKAVYADEDYDSNQEMSMSGGGGGSFNRLQNAINDAAREFARNNNYQAPTDPSQITPYLARTIDTATIQKYLNQFVVDPPSSEELLMAPLLKAYSEANSGQPPKSLSDLLPYATTPEQKAFLQKLAQNNPATK